MILKTFFRLSITFLLFIGLLLSCSEASDMAIDIDGSEVISEESQTGPEGTSGTYDSDSDSCDRTD